MGYIILFYPLFAQRIPRKNGKEALHMGKIIGIDLGTTNSLVSCWEDGTSRLIPNRFGEYLTPSVVSIGKNGTVYVGAAAKQRMITQPDSTVSVFKRSMGTDRTYNLRGKWYRAEELSALILKSLKEDAEAYLKEPVEEAVISVPAYFDDIARNATRRAGQLAGLRVDRIINEPSAAALACQHANTQQDAKLLVFDLGGGTLDVSLVDCMDNVIEILAVSGNNHLGGSDFDHVLAEHFCTKNQMVLGTLKPGQQEIILKAAEKAKIDLTYAEETVMRASFENNSWSLPVSRQTLIQISAPLFRKIAAPIKRVLNDAQLHPSDLTRVVMVGGSSKMFVVQQYLKFLLKNVPFAVADPDHMIAIGVGIFAGIKERNEDVKDLILTDICPFSLGTGIINQDDPAKGDYMSTLIPRNSSLPASHSGKYYTTANNQKQILFGVYQGEDLYVNNNLHLGEMLVNLTPKPKGEEYVNVRFTYDINGLLVVDLHVPSTGEKKQLVFVNGVTKEADEDLKKQMAELEKLVIAPKDDQNNQLILSRAEGLYAQLSGQPKELLANHIKVFTKMLEAGSKTKVMKASKALMEYMDLCEQLYLQKEDITGDLDEFQSWFTALSNAEDDDDIADWGGMGFLS